MICDKVDISQISLEDTVKCNSILFTIGGMTIYLLLISMEIKLIELFGYQHRNLIN